MRGAGWIVLCGLLAGPCLAQTVPDAASPPVTSAADIAPPTGESIVAGLSLASVAITADFTGEEILVYGAVRRTAPPPDAPPLEVIITVEGPPTSVTVRRKERVFGVWANVETIRIDRAPSFYAIASTGDLVDILSRAENLRHRITIPRAIGFTGEVAPQIDPAPFVEALIRIRQAEGKYALGEGGAGLAQDTLFHAEVRLPANLTEGDYRVRMFLLRGGVVLDVEEQTIPVAKAGLERWIFNLSREQPFIYGILSLLLAVVAGWGASAGFQLLRR